MVARLGNQPVIFGTTADHKTCEVTGNVLPPERAGIVMPGARSPRRRRVFSGRLKTWELLSVMDLNSLSDDLVRRAYEQIRDELMADARSGGPYRFMSAGAKARAEVLLTEIRRRGLNVPPINWPI